MSEKRVPTQKKIYRFARWQVAKWWLRLHPAVEVIGIAGSVGKTTTKEIVAAVLAQKFLTVKTEANFDPIFNLPLTALKIRRHKKFVAELGVDGVGQMDKYLDLVHPRIGVMTRLSLEHTELFGTLEMAMAEEVKLLRALSSNGWAVLNGDDPEIIASKSATKANCLTYGFSPGNDMLIKDFAQRVDGGRAQSSFRLRYGSEECVFKIYLLGKHNALCAAAAVAVGMVSGMKFEQIQKGLSEALPVSQRLNVKKGPSGRLIIDDTYNASPAAVEAAADVLVDLEPSGATLVLGDMLELGKYAEESHHRVGFYAAQKGVSHLVAYGDYAKTVITGFKAGGGQSWFAAPDKQSIPDWLNHNTRGAVLVKGSRGMKMEEVVEQLG
ncbi:UDP-N-acetylmuramoyl-tripeptide--D-alanyl-D-alanine ligase [Patescibacteria group bacterium]|nr:UDP-N-acetylmuramoyl-tripeptide--D-alanyl-D-alanine ligase [Patescibacteria group bacterium]